MPKNLNIFLNKKYVNKKSKIFILDIKTECILLSNNNINICTINILMMYFVNKIYYFYIILKITIKILT